MIRCPLCHVLHNDPPDVAGGRVRVCLGCHPTAKQPKTPARQRPKQGPAKPPGPPPAKDTAPKGS